MRIAIIVICLIPLLAAGCASKKQQDPPPVVKAPEKLDPTREYELPAWWTNGDHLLHLGEDGAYALYDGVNRYRQPAERGHWSQLNYAAIRLEPYAALAREASRGSIRLLDQALMLELPGQAPMMGFDGPPQVVEDRLLGRWTAGFGSLSLRDDLRYVYSLSPAQSRPAAVTRHAGTWRVEADTVVLRPDSAGMEPVPVRIRETDDEIVLVAPEGRLTRQPPIGEGG